MQVRHGGWETREKENQKRFECLIHCPGFLDPDVVTTRKYFYGDNVKGERPDLLDTTMRIVMPADPVCYFILVFKAVAKVWVGNQYTDDVGLAAQSWAEFMTLHSPENAYLLVPYCGVSGIVTAALACNRKPIGPFSFLSLQSSSLTRWCVNVQCGLRQFKRVFGRATKTTQ